MDLFTCTKVTLNEDFIFYQYNIHKLTTQTASSSTIQFHIFEQSVGSVAISVPLIFGTKTTCVEIST